jgi:hypothetical protein
MKKNLLLLLLLFVGFCANEGLKAQCPPVGDWDYERKRVATAYYDFRTGGDFVFRGATSYEAYGFRDVSPIVSGVRFSGKQLEFTIGEEWMSQLTYPYECHYDLFLFCRNTSWGDNLGFIRIYFQH